MEDFKFKQFIIQQNRRVFRVGTDGVLLGALASASNAQSGLEVGSGTGVVSLMLVQRYPSLRVTALDISQEAAALSQQNFNHSPFSNRLKAVQTDFLDFKTHEKFDFIFSNPPYFNAKESKDFTARQQVNLNFRQLIEGTRKLMAEDGIFSVILPQESATELVDFARKNDFNLVRKIDVFGIENGKVKRNVLEFSLHHYPFIKEKFVIESRPRVYSEQYKKATSEFHPMF